jgi:hypothetical protein
VVKVNLIQIGGDGLLTQLMCFRAHESLSGAGTAGDLGFTEAKLFPRVEEKRTLPDLARANPRS